jgi:hypothetical protein
MAESNSATAAVPTNELIYCSSVTGLQRGLARADAAPSFAFDFFEHVDNITDRVRSSFVFLRLSLLSQYTSVQLNYGGELATMYSTSQLKAMINNKGMMLTGSFVRSFAFVSQLTRSSSYRSTGRIHAHDQQRRSDVRFVCI